MTRPIIIVHGGAGDWPGQKQGLALNGVKAAAATGWRTLQKRESAVDAVEASVVSMENNPIFNAGTGATLNLKGRVEMDAAIMNGRDISGGAVGLIRGVKNPIRLARIVMDQTDHVLLAGQGAEKLAAAHGISHISSRTAEKVERWREGLALFKQGRMRRLRRNYRLFKQGILKSMDTVGAVARDQKGNLAVACSTGGLSLKLPGRIGDSAILGAGLYADNSAGAATATGIGEMAVRTAISKTACDLLRESSPKLVARECIDIVRRRIGRGLGILVLDPGGRYGVAHSTRHMCWAVAKGSEDTKASMFGTRV